MAKMIDLYIEMIFENMSLGHHVFQINLNQLLQIEKFNFFAYNPKPTLSGFFLNDLIHFPNIKSLGKKKILLLKNKSLVKQHGHEIVTILKLFILGDHMVCR